jgi:hypothetical protein
MEGTGLGQPYRAGTSVAGTSVPGAAAPARALGAARRLAVAVLGLAGVALVAGGLVQLSLAGHRALDQVQQVGTTDDTRRFAFDREAWRSLAVDEVFPPTYSTRSAAADGSATRTFTRIAVGPPAGCQQAFDEALVRLLSAAGCGPVLRADYTDATQTLVATMGVAVLRDTQAQQHDLNVATAAPHDDLRPRPLAVPGTAAASFHDAQRLAFELHAPADEPFVFFAVTGLADGRPATADPGSEAVAQSGAALVATSLESVATRQTDQAVARLWQRRSG